MYAHYLVDGDVKTSFLCMSELSNGTTKTITDTLCSDLELDMAHRLCGLGSDGAAVILRKSNGAVKLLKRRVPFLFTL